MTHALHFVVSDRMEESIRKTHEKTLHFDGSSGSKKTVQRTPEKILQLSGSVDGNEALRRTVEKMPKIGDSGEAKWGNKGDHDGHWQRDSDTKNQLHLATRKVRSVGLF